MDIFATLGLGAPRRYYGGNSGYVGYSKSKRAVAAEENGLRSKSQMDKAFADQVNAIIVENGGTPVTLKAIKAALPGISADEWHHTSMYGNKTDYYSAETIANFFSHIPQSSFKKNALISFAELDKLFDNFLSAKMPMFFGTTPTSNGVKIALWQAYNGIAVPFKSGFSVHQITANDNEEVANAKRHFNNEKRSLFVIWDDKLKKAARIYNPPLLSDSWGS